MKSKNMTLMVVAIGCGLVAAFLTARLAGGDKSEKAQVWVAKKEITVGTVIAEKDIGELLIQKEMDKKDIPQDIINNIDELKGKRVNRTLKPGNYFAPGDVGVDAGIKIPDGMFKYAIKMDGVKAVAGFVEPGNHVNVILTESMPNGKAKSGVILKNMLVLAVDTSARPTEGGGQGRQTVNSVSVAVTDKQSLILSSAEKRGEVRLLLRDDSSTDSKITQASTTIEGFDDDQKAQATGPVIEMVSVVYAKADVPMNTHVTKDNFDKFFATREVPKELLNAKSIQDPASLQGKFIVKALEADQYVFSTMLGDKEAELQVKTVIVEKTIEVPAKVEPQTAEVLPIQPREVVVEGPQYPRKFEQIINNQRVWFLETAPGQFRRVEGDGVELKNVPTTNGTSDEKKEEKKPATGDRNV